MKKITFIIFLITASFGFSQTLVEGFEGVAPTVNWADDPSGLATAAVSSAQANTGTNSLEIITSATGHAWQGAQLLIQGDGMDLTTATGNKVVTVAVYSTVATDILAKVTVGAGPDSATDASHTGSGWETLSFNFANPKDNTAAADGIYTDLIFYPLWNNLGGTCSVGCFSPYGTPGQSAQTTIYVDDIMAVTAPPPPTCSDGIQNQGETGVDCGGPNCSACPAPPGSPPTTPPNRDPAEVLSVYSDAYTDVATEQREAFGDAVVTDLDYSGNSIISATTPLAGAGFQYQYIASPLDLSPFSNLHIDYYFEGNPATAGTFFTVICQYAGGSNAVQLNIDVTSLASNTWHETDVTFASFDGGAPRDQIQQIIVQINGPDIYGPFYVDNIYFHNNTVLSNNDFSKSSFSVFPNPTQDSWNIKTQSINIQSIKVYDVLGKSVMTLTPNESEATIDASSLVKGMYFAKIETESGSSSIKLIKQ